MSKTAGEIGKTILTVLGAIGIVAVAVMAPNMIQIFGKAGHYTNKQYKRSLSSLRNKKLVKIKESKGKLHIQLTRRGHKQLAYNNIYNIRLKKESKWDKKWRVIIFDIPVSHNKARDELTYLLKELGFKMLQKSAWVCPWSCETEVEQITSVFQIDDFVKIILANKIPDSQKLEKYFRVT